MFYKYRIFLLLAVFGFLGAHAQKKTVTVEDIWQRYAFYARSTSGLNSMNDGEHFTILQANKTGPSIEKFSYATGKQVETLVSAAKIKEASGKSIDFDDYQFNATEDKILLATETESIYRHSSRSYYYVYDLKTQQLDSIKAEDKQQLADLSPTENKVAFVAGNRMHIQDLDNNNEIISFGQGQEDALIAGAVDWVYEEEFSFHKGFEWSPKGRYIAYYQFDESAVPTFSMDVYGQGLYPSQDVFKYPKAGEVNSKVNIHIYDSKTNKDYSVEIPQAYEYIPRIKWTKEEDELVIFTLNRHQNELVLWEVEVENEELEVEELYRETAEAYLEINDNLRFLDNGDFIWTSEKDGYNHIYLMDDDGKVKKQITKGPWEVTEFYGYSAESGYLYYQAAEENSVQRAIYRIKLNGKNKQKLSQQKGWNDANFSKGMKYFVNTYSSASRPTYETLHQADGKELRVITDNASLVDRLETYDLSDKEFMVLDTENGQSLNAWMIKPQDFDASKKYPVLMFVYGGPGSQTVQDKYDSFNSFWYQSLAAQGYIVVSVDNRGTGAKGRDFRTVTYQELGKYEIEDQISAAKTLGQMDYIDASRIGIWGWSYGGYMSSLGITKGADVFKAAIAVAPVTNWRFYDNIYTERYMRTPQENASGYDENSPINHVNKLRGSYFLVHGTADDNVHVQNTMRMVESLVQSNKQFDLFIYPDKNHGIFGGNTRYHLYTKMTDFLLKNL
ncbi:MAG: S9 family peptidase [Bacteroidetes bacterium]|nr:MAG: S9 family peptidase [Bacteroidota bacterium]